MTNLTMDIDLKWCEHFSEGILCERDMDVPVINIRFAF